MAPGRPPAWSGKTAAAAKSPYGIRTNCLCPGTILTETSCVHYQQHPAAKEELLALYPGKAFGEPADVAQCALYMASDAARFMNGSVVVLDGGLSAVHRLSLLWSNNGPLDPTEVLHDSDTANIRTRNPD